MLNSNSGFIFSLLILFTSCTSNSYKDIPTYTVTKKNFENSLTINGFVEPVNSTSIVLPPCDGTILFLVEDGVYVEEGDLVCNIEWQELQSYYNQMSMQLETEEIGLIKMKADLNMQLAILEAQVRTNDADTKIAQMDSLKIAFMSSKEKLIKELELEKATVEKARYEKKLAALKVIQQSDIKKKELEIARLNLNIGRFKEQLDALTIKAPKSGLFLRGINPLTGSKLNVGDPVWARFTVATMPQFDKMKVKILALETDFKSINVNDSVYYTFDAMPGNEGTGKILKKTPMGQPYKRGSTVKFFEIEASIDSVLTIPEPGFTANCKVFIKQVENTLSVPQIAIFDDDSMKVVFVQRKRGFEKRQVLTSISSPKESVISAGLNEGEVIALSKPKLSLVKEMVALPDTTSKKPVIPIEPLIPKNFQDFNTNIIPIFPYKIVQP